MYRADEIVREIVKQYRRPTSEPRVSSAGDIKASPNDVLASYLLSDGLSGEEFSALLRHPKDLERTLRGCVPADDNGLAPVIGAMEARSLTQNYVVQYGSRFLVADAKPMTHEYPSGLRVDYALLTNECSANMSTFEFGHNLPATRDVYLREQFFTVMCALFKAAPDHAHWYSQGHDDTILHDLTGVALAHELNEMRLDIAGKLPKSPIACELAAERSARTFLLENGVDPAAYEAFHALRAGPHEGAAKDISALVLENLRSSPSS